ncbi:hypothetical protein PYCC9005_003364 [Savitreella phatthalungensis]
MAKDHYAVLGVNTDADDGEIRRAYRSAALRLHPDRFARTSGHDSEDREALEARRNADFSALQLAYEILSDPNERAWYDREREALLRRAAYTDALGTSHLDDDLVQREDDREAVGLSSDDILRAWEGIKAAKLDDGASGFFTLARKLFEGVDGEEGLAAVAQEVDHDHLPGFGGSKSDGAAARRFYDSWLHFTTLKEFWWTDRYPDVHAAPDRRVRRLMEKENGRCRAAARKEYSETIRRIVTLTMKRDYRCVGEASEGGGRDTAAQRTERLKEAAAEKARRDRQAHLDQLKSEEYVEQDWTQTSRAAADEQMAAFEEFEGENVVHECVACDKRFKTEKQYGQHAKSKKHLQQIKQLQREMRREARQLGLDEPDVRVRDHHGDDPDLSDDFATASEGEDGDDSKQHGHTRPRPAAVDDHRAKEHHSSARDTATEGGVDEVEESSRDEDSDYGPPAAFERRLTGDDELEDLADDLDILDVESEEEFGHPETQHTAQPPPQPSKSKKARQKAKARAKLKKRS